MIHPLHGEPARSLAQASSNLDTKTLNLSSWGKNSVESLPECNYTLAVSGFGSGDLFRDGNEIPEESTLNEIY
nr:ASN_HP1_G0050690.mRNA.1.CDS.1 [Saccharomyces cerevisiae]